MSNRFEWFSRVAMAVVALHISAGILPGQILGVPGTDGFQFYGVYGSANYSSSSTTGLGVLPGNASGTFKSTDYMGSIGTSLGWFTTGTKTRFAITYSPSYFGSARYSDANSLNHSLQISSGSPRRLSRRWTFDLGLSANILTFNAFMFTPLGISGAAVSGASLADLSSAFVRKEIRTDVLASTLANGATLDTAARAFYGGRSLSLGAQGSFIYQYSQRLSVSLGVGGGRTQSLNSHDAKQDPQWAASIFSSNNLFTQAQLSYSLTPQTSVGVSTQASRSLSTGQDSWATNSRAFVSHTYRRWFFAGFGGVGAILPVKSLYQLKLGPQMSMGGSVGAKVGSHVFLAAVDRSAGDTFGVGGYANTTSSATWFWQIPGSTWTVGANFGHQLVETVAASNLDGWRGGVNIQKYLSAGFSVFANYASFYARSDFSATPFRLKVNAVSVGVNWSPSAERALRRGGAPLTQDTALPGTRPQ